MTDHQQKPGQQKPGQLKPGQLKPDSRNQGSYRGRR